jgi:hypothetical protein
MVGPCRSRPIGTQNSFGYPFGEAMGNDMVMDKLVLAI